MIITIKLNIFLYPYNNISSKKKKIHRLDKNFSICIPPTNFYQTASYQLIYLISHPVFLIKKESVLPKSPLHFGKDCTPMRFSFWTTKFVILREETHRAIGIDPIQYNHFGMVWANARRWFRWIIIYYHRLIKYIT